MSYRAVSLIIVASAATAATTAHADSVSVTTTASWDNPGRAWGGELDVSAGLGVAGVSDDQGCVQGQSTCATMIHGGEALSPRVELGWRDRIRLGKGFGLRVGVSAAGMWMSPDAKLHGVSASALGTLGIEWWRIACDVQVGVTRLHVTDGDMATTLDLQSIAEVWQVALTPATSVFARAELDFVAQGRGGAASATIGLERRL